MSGGSPLATSGTVAVAAAVPAATIFPNDPGILYSPGNWDVTSARAETANDGAYFRTLIGGSPSEVTLLFNVAGQTTTNIACAYRVDKGPWTRVQPAASVLVPLPAASNVWTRRLVEFAFVAHDTGLWDESENVRFLGIATTPGNCTASLPMHRPLNGLVFGDSISAGIFALHSSTSTFPQDSDATLGYAFALADSLGAEVGVIAFGGTDVTQGYKAIPATGSTYNVLWGGGPARNFSSLDFIAVNLGTNGNAVADSIYTPAYTDLLNKLLAANSTARIFAMEPFGGFHPTGIQAAIAACSAPSRVKYVDTTAWWTTADSGDGTHPWGYAAFASLAPRLAGVIRTTLGAVSGSMPPVSLW